MELELNLEIISKLAKERETENIEFRSFLKSQDDDEVDRIVHSLHEKITAEIDCTECGNCCNILMPAVTREEIERLSAIDGMEPEEFEEKFTETEKFEESRYLKTRPCKYLKGKICSIYPDRPEDCRSYPHTHKKDFIGRLYGIIDNYGVCPIVFNLYEMLKQEYGFRYR